MTPEDALLRTQAWIHKKIAESKRPFADPFNLTSVGYCIGQAIGMMQNREAFEEAFALVRKITIAQNGPTYDVFSPEEILELIERALAFRED